MSRGCVLANEMPGLVCGLRQVGRASPSPILPLPPFFFNRSHFVVQADLFFRFSLLVNGMEMMGQEALWIVG